jgi:hypothetical protein
MNRLRAMGSRHRIAIGGVLGVVVALSLSTGVRDVLGSGTSAKWWPLAVAAALGGGVVGAIVGVEADGELPDEGYDGAPARRTDSRPEAP